MIEFVKQIDEWAMCKCSCGETFEVDACFQENLILINSRLTPQCPYCDYIYKKFEGCLTIDNKIRHES